MEFEDRSIYHFEAAIASEHVHAIKFENTKWDRILEYYEGMYTIMPSDNILLSKATIYLQIDQLDKAKSELVKIDPKALSQREYLFHGCYSEYYEKVGDMGSALQSINLAISACTNQFEKQYLEKRKKRLNDKV